MRRRQLMARAATGDPDKFITLTVNPALPGTPDDHALILSNGWRNAVKRLRRAFPGKRIEYLAVFEKHKSGEPHLHLLVKSPFIPQAVLSQMMRELIDSPIVDIRAIRGQRSAILYVAKYVTKDNVRFGTAKRYWFSRGYELKELWENESDLAPDIKWLLSRIDASTLLTFYRSEGFRFEPTDREIYWGIRPPRPPSRLRTAGSRF